MPSHATAPTYEPLRLVTKASAAYSQRARTPVAAEARPRRPVYAQCSNKDRLAGGGPRAVDLSSDSRRRAESRQDEIRYLHN